MSKGGGVHLFVAYAADAGEKKESEPAFQTGASPRFAHLGWFASTELAVQRTTGPGSISLAFIVPGDCLVPKIPAKHKDDDIGRENKPKNECTSA